MSLERYDVVIIGGGIMGAATAFFLRTLHGKSVVLLERGFVGAGASGVNFGNVRRQGRFLPQIPLSHRSREIWGRLPELLGEDCEFLPTGGLRVAYSQADMAVIEKHVAEARDWDLHLDLLGQNAMRSRWPWLGPDVVGASLSPEDGHANPRLVAPAFGRAARRAGAVIHEHCEVADIQREASGFRVTTRTGLAVRGEVLLNSAGFWGSRIAEAFGEPVPIVARGPQMAVTEPLPYFMEPVLGGVSSNIYLRQVKRGNVVYGGGLRGPVQTDPPRARPTPDLSMSQWGRVLRFVPALAGVQVIRTWTGVEGYLEDDIPVMGESGTTPGLFHAFGFCGHGFQLGPGVGAVMAELLATGRTSTPIEPFHIRRFAGRQAGGASEPAPAG
ncbi:sarcosine oxidase subunit beta [Allostella sp. ATCC 35155]|nr:sarcosine oxidase subunit beta [Stella sp. ATCC 35155]